jgi:hypothetical protein
MKKLIFTLVVLLISAFSVQAQTEKKLNTGNVSIYLAEDYSSEEEAIREIFTGFGEIGEGKCNIVVRIQDFEPNVVHQLEIKFIDPNNESMFEDEKLPFILKSNINVYNHKLEVDAKFTIEGVYQVQVWIDGKFVQYLNFNVGNSVGLNKGKGNVSMVVASDYLDDSSTIMGMYTGIKSPKEGQLKLILNFQDFPLNVVNKAIIKLITPTGKNLLNKQEITFTHGKSTKSYTRIENMNVPLLESGVYQFQVEINGKMVQYLNFSVGNE